MNDQQGADEANESGAVAPSATAASGNRDTDAERRAILKSLGKLAALTPPTVVMLMTTTRPAAAS